MKNKIWIFLTTVFFISNVITLGWVLSESTFLEIEELKNKLQAEQEKTGQLRKKHQTLLSEHKYLLETLLENSDNLQHYMPEYAEVTQDQFKEKLRQKVVKINLILDEMEEQNEYGGR